MNRAAVISWSKIEGLSAVQESAPPLNNGQLSPATKDNLLKRRAKAKFLSLALSRNLYDLDTPMKGKYFRSMNCAREIMQKGEKFTSHYCGAKWCLVCNRIRTGKLINKYLQLSEHLKDAQFVTLTIKNCIDCTEDMNRETFISEIRYTQRKMFKHFRRVADMFRKYGLKIKGVRAYECIPTKDSRGARPHIHMKIDGTMSLIQFRSIWTNQGFNLADLAIYTDLFNRGEITAGRLKGELIIQCWLKEFQGIAERAGQHVTPCKDGTEMELFKYSTKLLVKNKNGARQVPLKVLDAIFDASQGVRSVTVTGFVTRAPKDKTGQAYQEYLLYKELTGAMDGDINALLESVAAAIEPERPLTDVFTWHKENWFSVTDGTPLTIFQVSDGCRMFISAFNSS